MRVVLLMAIVSFASVSIAGEIPWQGTEIVVGADQAGETLTLSEPASATAVKFDAKATIDGTAALTMLSPSKVIGAGSLLVPLAGENGLDVGGEVRSSIFITDADQVVWKDVQLSSIKSVSAALCGNWCSQRPLDMIAVAFANNGTTATVQFQQKDNQHVKVFKVQYTQSGSDVVAKALWAAHSTNFNTLGLDWDKDTIPNRGTYAPPYSQAIDADRIGLTYLSFSEVTNRFGMITLDGTLPTGAIKLNAEEVAFTPRLPLTLANAITGTVKRVVFASRPGGDAQLTSSGYIGTDEILAFENASIQSVRFASGHLYGMGLNTNVSVSAGTVCTVNKFTASDTRIVQVQAYQDSGTNNRWTKCVDVQFRQVGTDVYAKALIGRFGSGNRLGTYVGDGDGTCSVITSDSDSAKGYGIKNFVFDVKEKKTYLTLSGTSIYLDANHRTVFDGTQVTLSNSSALSAQGGVYDITNGAKFATSCALRDLSETFNVYKDSTLEVNVDWGVRPDNIINVCGGVLKNLRNSYLGKTTALSDGGRITSVNPIRIYNANGKTVTIATTGSSPCYIEGGLCGAKVNSNGSHILNIVADLYLTGYGLLDVESQYNGFVWRKTGSGKLYAKGACRTVNPIKIEAGAVVLSDGAILNTNLVTLAGGALETGNSTSNCVKLALSSDSSLAIGTGATVEVPAVDIWDTTKQLVVSGATAPDGTLGLLIPTASDTTVLPTLRYRDFGGNLHKVERDTSTGLLRAVMRGTVFLFW